MKAIKSSTSKITNSKFSGTNGAENVGDRGGMQFIGNWTSNPYDDNNYVTKWRTYINAYEKSWEARKIVRIPVEDALRKPWIVEGIDTELAKDIQNFSDRIQFHAQLKRALMLERLLGGSLIFLGLEGEEDELDSSYNPREGRSLRFANAIPISRIARATWCHDPLSEHYMRPEQYLINGQNVHISRFLCFDGKPLFDPYDYALTNFRANLAGFGQSKLAPLWDDLVMAVGTRQAAYQLIQVNNTIIAAISDLQDLQGTTSGKKALDKVKEIANQMSVYRAAVIDGEKVDITQSSASFGSVPELLMMYLQVLSAASDIPATRFLGQAPGGLNASGESDLENYYNVIDAYQRQEIEPQLRRFYDIVGHQIAPERWKTEREELRFNWPPLWNEKESEVSVTKAQYLTNVMTAIDAGLMGDKAAIEELNQKNVFGVKLDEIDRDLMAGAEEAQQPIDLQAEISKLRQSNPIKIQGSFDPIEVELGMKSEQEHKHLFSSDNIPDEEQIRGIVMDHLKEDPKYYSKLKSAGMLENSSLSIDVWYDRQTRFWVGMVKDANGNTIGESEYQPTKELARKFAEENRKDILAAEMITNATWQRKNGEYIADLGKNTSALIRRTPSDEWALYYFATDDGPHRAEWHDTYRYLETAKSNVDSGKSWAQSRFSNAADYPPKEHMKLHGLDIMIETPKGNIRRGDGWEVIMPAHYGEFCCAGGSDQDPVDVYIGPNMDSNLVFVVEQVDADSQQFDEHKCIMGCDSMTDAYELYTSGFSDGRGRERWGGCKQFDIEDFKIWLATDTTNTR